MLRPFSYHKSKRNEIFVLDCGSGDCSGLQIMEGPWGDKQIQNVQLSCQVMVTEDKKPGEFTLLLNLDRDVYSITVGLSGNRHINIFVGITKLDTNFGFKLALIYLGHRSPIRD